jgi:hypothetical protein
MPRFTITEKQYLMDNYLKDTVGEMAAILDRDPSSVRYHLEKVLLVKLPKEVGIKKQRSVASENFKKHQFKAGHVPITKHAEGKIVTWYDERMKKSYKWIRVNGKWMHLSLHNWIKAGKEIPARHLVVFKTADTLNCEVDNLECISRSENIIRNSKHRKPARDRSIEKSIKANLQQQKLLHRQQLQLQKLEAKKELNQQKQIENYKRELLSLSKVVKKPKAPVIRSSKIKEPEKKQMPYRVYKTLPAERRLHIGDFTSLIPVRIDHRTTVYVKPGADIQAIIKRYQKAS